MYVPPATKRGVLLNFTRSCRRIDGTLISLSVHRFSCFRGKFGLQNELGKLSHAASNSSNCTSRVSGLICFSQLVYISRYCLFARTTFRDEGYYVNASFTRQMGRKNEGAHRCFPIIFKNSYSFSFTIHHAPGDRRDFCRFRCRCPGKESSFDARDRLSKRRRRASRRRAIPLQLMPGSR